MSNLLRNQPATHQELLDSCHRLNGYTAVTFPHNDYRIAGHVRTCAPTKMCKIHQAKDGRLYVRFNRSLWEIIEAVANELEHTGDKPNYRHVFVKTIECWKHEDTNEVFKTSTDK